VSVVRLIAPSDRDYELSDLLTICISSMARAAGISGAERADEFGPAFLRVLALARAELGLK
jgi:hypothetical protein